MRGCPNAAAVSLNMNFLKCTLLPSLVLGIFAFAPNAWASGFDAPHVGSGSAGPTSREPSAVHWNPGQLGYLEAIGFDFGGGVIVGSATYTRNRALQYQFEDNLDFDEPIDPSDIDPAKTGAAERVSSTPVGPILDLFVAVPVIPKRFTLAAGLYVPYAAVLDLPDDGPQRFAAQSLTLASVHTTVAAGVKLHKTVSIGAGVSYVFSILDLRKVQDFGAVDTFADGLARPPINQANDFGPDAPATVRELDVLGRPIEVSGVSHSLSFNAGIAVRPTDHIDLAFVYQHGSKLRFKGDFTLDMDDDFFTQDLAPQGLEYPTSVSGDALVQLRLPKRLTLGGGYQFTRRVRVDAWLGYAFYQDFDTIEIKLTSPELAQPELGIQDSADQPLVRNWVGTVSADLVPRVQATDKLQVNLLAGYQGPASPDSTIDMASPDGHRIVFGAGVGYQVGPRFRFLADFEGQVLAPRTVTQSDFDLGNGEYGLFIANITLHGQLRFGRKSKRGKPAAPPDDGAPGAERNTATPAGEDDPAPAVPGGRASPGGGAARNRAGRTRSYRGWGCAAASAAAAATTRRGPARPGAALSAVILGGGTARFRRCRIMSVLMGTRTVGTVGRTAAVLLAGLYVPGCADTTAGERPTETDGETEPAAESSEGTTGGETGVPPSDFGPETEFELRLNVEEAPPLVLEMNREEVTELFGDRADEVLLIELDSAALLRNTLEEVKHACGDRWMLDNEDPQHDCSETALGRSFSGPDGTWRTSPEYAMVRILTMTPANVDVVGTSSENLAALADALGIGGGYGEILANALGIPRTQEIVSTDSLVRAFQENFVASHPNIGDDAQLDFFLADALSDLATMTDRYGPTGDHPGIVAPDFVVNGEVFGPQFLMRAVANSNLQTVDGLDAEAGKGFLTIVVDQTGPTYDDELEFDFTDPSRFSLEGVVEDLGVDMKFAIPEHGAFVQSCLGSPPCHDNQPGSPTDDFSVWATDPWTLEFNIAAAARHDYVERIFVDSYLLGTAKVEIGQDDNPPGWIHYSIPLNIGNPPEDQFLWETILEVAQVALHRTQFANFGEGDADIAFVVRDIPIGITGSQAAEKVRPFLQEQAPELSDFILGNYQDSDDPVDIYWRQTESGQPYLFFSHPDDLAEGRPYDYGRPGFFASSSLSEESRVSGTVIPGLADTVREKVYVAPGESTVYFEDEWGSVFRLRLLRDDDADESVTVFLAKAGA